MPVFASTCLFSPVVLPGPSSQGLRRMRRLRTTSGRLGRLTSHYTLAFSSAVLFNSFFRRWEGGSDVRARRLAFLGRSWVLLRTDAFCFASLSLSFLLFFILLHVRYLNQTKTTMSSPPHESLHPVVVHSPLRPFTLPPSSSSTPNNTPSFRHRVLSSTASTGKGQRTRVYDFRDPASPVFRPAGLDDVCKEGSKGGATYLWSVDLQLETEDINSTSTTPDHSPRAQLEWRNISLGRGSDDRRRLAYESAGGRRGSASLREVMSEQGSPTPVGRTSRRERKRTRTESLAGGGGSYFADQKLGGRPGLNPPRSVRFCFAALDWRTTTEIDTLRIPLCLS